jgi:DNA invertase Pin-like site-specific DNA recombinase
MEKIRRELQEVEKNQAVRLFRDGRKKSEIADILGFDRSTISNCHLPREMTH